MIQQRELSETIGNSLVSGNHSLSSGNHVNLQMLHDPGILKKSLASGNHSFQKPRGSLEAFAEDNLAFRLPFRLIIGVLFYISN